MRALGGAALALGALINWSDDEHVVLADLGYEGENTRLICPIKNTRRGDSRPSSTGTINALHSATRPLAECGNSLLKTTVIGLVVNDGMRCRRRLCGEAAAVSPAGEAGA